MGLMDMVTQAAGAFGGDHAKVAGGLMEEINNHGGASAIFSAFQSNGMGGLVQQWAGGNTAPAQPEEVAQGLSGTGVIEGIENKTGVSSSTITSALAVILPMVIHHFAASGHVTETGEPTGQPAPEPGGMLQSILGKLL